MVARPDQRYATPVTPLDHRAPQASPLEARLAVWWRDSMGLAEISADDDFFALGGTSVQAAQIFGRIATDLGVKLPLATLYEAPSVRALAAEIVRAQAARRQPARPAGAPDGRLVTLQTGAGRSPLYIVPGVGGGVVGLAHLARALGSAYPVHAFESRGLRDGEQPLADMQAIAAEYVADLRRWQPEGPYQLFGVCWGGVVVLEMARQLAAEGAPPRLTLLLDPPPFDRPGAVPAAKSFALPRFVGTRLRLYWQELQALPRAQRPAYLRNRLRLVSEIVRQRDLFRGDDSELRRERVRSANIAAARAYCPQTPTAPVELMFTEGRPDGRSRAGREWWVELTGSRRDPVYVPGHDTGDAISPAFAGHVANVLRPRLL